jgi:hypothetical protein
VDAKCPKCSATFETQRSGLQFCPACGQQISVPDSSEVLSSYTPGTGGGGPPGDVPPSPPEGGSDPSGPPWERRRQVGAFGGFWQTWVESMFQPHLFWPRVTPGGPWLDALAYAWILQVLLRLFHLPLAGLERKQTEMMLEWLKTQNLGPFFEKALQGAQGSQSSPVAAAVLTLLLFPVFLFATAAIIHALCLMLDAAKNGFWATFRAVAYSYAPMLFAWVPCLNMLAAVYFVVQLILGVQALQQTTPGKAVAAVLLPTFILCCCCLALGMFGLGMAGAMGAMEQ